MTKKRAGTEPLRGEDAWLAAKADMTKRNEAARDRIAKERTGHEARRTRERQEQERLEAGTPPLQQGR